MDIKELLKTKRIQLCLTQDEVANAVGVSRSCYCKWEKGYIENMGIDKIEALSKTLHIDPASFIFGTDVTYLDKWEEYFKTCNFNENELDELKQYCEFIISKRKN